MKKAHLYSSAFFAACFAMQAVAHHSGAMFDSAKDLTLVGTVKEFQFVNPHLFLYVVAPDASGKQVTWTLEGGSPSALVRRGVGKDAVLIGEKVTVTAHPIKDGSPAGQLLTVTKSNGSVVQFQQGRY